MSLENNEGSTQFLPHDNGDNGDEELSPDESLEVEPEQLWAEAKHLEIDKAGSAVLV